MNVMLWYYKRLAQGQLRSDTVPPVCVYLVLSRSLFLIELCFAPSKKPVCIKTGNPMATHAQTTDLQPCVKLKVT